MFASVNNPAIANTVTKPIAIKPMMMSIFISVATGFGKVPTTSDPVLFGTVGLVVWVGTGVVVVAVEKDSEIYLVYTDRMGLTY